MANKGSEIMQVARILSEVNESVFITSAEVETAAAMVFDYQPVTTYNGSLNLQWQGTPPNYYKVSPQYTFRLPTNNNPSFAQPAGVAPALQATYQQTQQANPAEESGNLQEIGQFRAPGWSSLSSASDNNNNQMQN